MLQLILRKCNSNRQKKTLKKNNLNRGKGVKYVKRENILMFLRDHKFSKSSSGFSSIYLLNRFICIEAITENKGLFH